MYSAEKKERPVLKNFSYFLMLQLIPIFVLSSYLVYEINPYLYKKQIVYYMIAAVAFTVVMFIPWRKIMWWFSPLYYVVNMALLAAVPIVGVSVLGAKRWIHIPGTPLTIQPSEFMKVSVIMLLAYLIAKKPPQKSGYGLFNFIKLSIVIIIPFLLIAKEPDLGTALVLLITGYGILFIIGIDWKIWTVIIILIGAAAPMAYEYGLKDYQKKRIVDAVSKPSYQVRQALIAIGSGGLEGKSKEDSTQTQLKFLPVSSTDFIFAYLGERFGFKGMLTLIGLYALVILNLLYISYKHSEDYYIKTFSTGLAFLFFVYMGVNIYMIIGMAPVVGLPLPMFSHGGTSFIIFAVIFGILQNLIIFKENKRYNSGSKTNMIP
ncbi:RodA protein homolog [hydrothermal vent metagenome]|uniref:RodA protein homolog n=1 Tax=hydrothermal vent metagenome TaxID=652676 RepID=A0A1W1EE00_9ZZZZ